MKQTFRLVFDGKTNKDLAWAIGRKLGNINPIVTEMPYNELQKRSTIVIDLDTARFPRGYAKYGISKETLNKLIDWPKIMNILGRNKLIALEEKCIPTNTWVLCLIDKCWIDVKNKELSEYIKEGILYLSNPANLKVTSERTGGAYRKVLIETDSDTNISKLESAIVYALKFKIPTGKVKVGKYEHDRRNFEIKGLVPLNEFIKC